jgi:hypothetical protein
MAYNTPPTKSVGDPFTASEWNTYIRDNFAAGFPDLAAAKGDILVATAANAAQALTAGSNYQVLEALSSETTGVRWAGNAPAARLYRTTAQSIGNDSDTQIIGFTADYDYGSFISGNTFVIPITGLYLLEASGYWSTNATANKLRQIGIDIGGSKVWQTTTSDADARAIHLSLMRTAWLTATTIIKMQALQISGGSLNFNDANLKITKLR